MLVYRFSFEEMCRNRYEIVARVRACMRLREVAEADLAGSDVSLDKLRMWLLQPPPCLYVRPKLMLDVELCLNTTGDYLVLGKIPDGVESEQRALLTLYSVVYEYAEQRSPNPLMAEFVTELLERKTYELTNGLESAFVQHLPESVVDVSLLHDLWHAERRSRTSVLRLCPDDSVKLMRGVVELIHAKFAEFWIDRHDEAMAYRRQSVRGKRFVVDQIEIRQMIGKVRSVQSKVSPRKAQP